MSVNRFLATITIALAAFGTACSPGGVVPENTAEQPVVVTDETTTPAAPAEIEQNTPVESVEQVADTGSDAPEQPVESDGFVFDEAYILDLEARMMAAPDVESLMVLMSEWVTYLDSMPDEDGVTTTLTVDEGAIEDIASMYGVPVAEVEALIDSDPALKSFMERAEVVPAEAEENGQAEPVEQTVESTDDAAVIDLGDHVEEDEWYDPVFFNPEYQDVAVPWGRNGDHTCGTHLEHVDSDFGETWSGGNVDNGWLVDANSTATAWFATPGLAEEAFWGMFQCDAERLTDTMMFALGMDGGQPVYLAFEEYLDDYGVTIFEAPDAGIVVIFAWTYDQVTVHVQYGLDVWTALDEMWWQLGS